ncbi:MAG: hypothetical protein ACFE94_08105 [Candidatus Hodarchaeota archaeon]
MNIYEKFMNETICAIMNIIRYEYRSIITVKKIRNFYNITSIDNSKINFYWRCLQSLEETGILRRYGPKKPRKYRVLNFFKLFELFHDTYVNQGMLTKNL